MLAKVRRARYLPTMIDKIKRVFDDIDFSPEEKHGFSEKLNPFSLHYNFTKLYHKHREESYVDSSGIYKGDIIQRREILIKTIKEFNLDLYATRKVSNYNIRKTRTLGAHFLKEHAKVIKNTHGYFDILASITPKNVNSTYNFFEKHDAFLPLIIAIIIKHPLNPEMYNSEYNAMCSIMDLVGDIASLDFEADNGKLESEIISRFVATLTPDLQLFDTDEEGKIKYDLFKEMGCSFETIENLIGAVPIPDLFTHHKLPNTSSKGDMIPDQLSDYYEKNGKDLYVDVDDEITKRDVPYTTRNATAAKMNYLAKQMAKANDKPFNPLTFEEYSYQDFVSDWKLNAETLFQGKLIENILSPNSIDHQLITRHINKHRPGGHEYNKQGSLVLNNDPDGKELNWEKTLTEKAFEKVGLYTRTSPFNLIQSEKWEKAFKKYQSYFQGAICNLLQEDGSIITTVSEIKDEKINSEIKSHLDTFNDLAKNSQLEENNEIDAKDKEIHIGKEDLIDGLYVDVSNIPTDAEIYIHTTCVIPNSVKCKELHIVDNEDQIDVTIYGNLAAHCVYSDKSETYNNNYLSILGTLDAVEINAYTLGIVMGQEQFAPHLNKLDTTKFNVIGNVTLRELISPDGLIKVAGNLRADYIHGDAIEVENNIHSNSMTSTRCISTKNGDITALDHIISKGSIFCNGVISCLNEGKILSRDPREYMEGQMWIDVTAIQPKFCINRDFTVAAKSQLMANDYKVAHPSCVYKGGRNIKGKTRNESSFKQGFKL